MSSWGIDFIIAHTGAWINIFVILAIIAFVALLIYFILRRRKMVKTEKELEDLLEEKYEREGKNVDTYGTSQPAQASAGAAEPASSSMPEYK